MVWFYCALAHVSSVVALKNPSKATAHIKMNKAQTMNHNKDYISANLPAIDFDDTRQFYACLGFQCVYQSAEWMILTKDSLLLEFFHHPHLNSTESWFSACLRTHVLQDLFDDWHSLDWAAFPKARITEIQSSEKMDMFCVIDPNGSLIRCIQIDKITRSDSDSDSDKA